MMAMTERQRSRLAALEAVAPPERSRLNLHCLTDDELIVLATLPTSKEGAEIVPPHLEAEVARIIAKAEAAANG